MLVTCFLTHRIGCFFGSLASFILGTPLGRCRTIILGAIVLQVGALVQGLAHSASILILGRIVAGLGQFHGIPLRDRRTFHLLILHHPQRKQHRYGPRQFYHSYTPH